LAGRDNTIAFWKRFLPYRDLCRRHDGSFMTQPWPHKREGDLGTGNYVNKGPMWSTGGFALSYLSGSQRLAMLGRRDSCFAVDAPAELKPALNFFRIKDYETTIYMAQELRQSSDPRVAKLATQLEDVARRNMESIPLTLASMERNLQAGDLYTLKYQLLAIASVLKPDDDRLAKFQEAMKDPNLEEILRNGAQFDRAIKGPGMEGEKGFNAIIPCADARGQGILKGLANKPDAPYGQAAVEALKDAHPVSLRAGKAITTLKPGPDQKPGKTHTLSQEFTLTDPDELDRLFLSYQTAKTLKVRLNGTLIIDLAFERPDASPVAILLKPVTRELLENGKNTLVVDVTPGGPGFEVSLKRGS
jgi:hypothetical protein